MTSPALDSFPVVLFDLDGTITDSAPGIHGGFRHALSSVGRPEPTADMLAAVTGPPMIDTFRSMGMADDELDAAIGAYLERYDAIGWSENSVFDGMADVLARASAHGTRLAVATSKSEGLPSASSSTSNSPTISSSSAAPASTAPGGPSPM